MGPADRMPPVGEHGPCAQCCTAVAGGAPGCIAGAAPACGIIAGGAVGAGTARVGGGMGPALRMAGSIARSASNCASVGFSCPLWRRPRYRDKPNALYSASVTSSSKRMAAGEIVMGSISFDL